MDVKKITQKSFEEAYNTYKPNWWIRIAFKYFSNDTIQKDMKPSQIWVWVCFGLIVLGIILTAFKVPRPILGTISYTHIIIFIPLVLSLFVAGFMNNFRIHRIRKFLGVSKKEYYYLVRKFGDNIKK